MRSAASGPEVAWIESLDPWPVDGFGLDRMRRLLARLGDPQRAYPSIHVVGTNGKGTTTRTIEGALSREGLRTGCYTSPHVTGWAERIRVLGREVDVERAIARIRPDAEAEGATQFEALTAAALAAFAEAGVDVAAVEAGLGGRHDATNVLRSPVQVLTNVSLEHTDVLGATRELIAAEKLAVVRPGATVVIGEPEWGALARRLGAGRVMVADGGSEALAAAACEAFLGRPVEVREVRLPGRLEWRGDELWDGAHSPAAARWLAPRLPRLGALVVSMLADKDVEGFLSVLAGAAPVLVATSSSSPRSLAAAELAARAAPFFDRVEIEATPTAAVDRALALGRPVLVTGSLALLADLAPVRPSTSVPWAAPARS